MYTITKEFTFSASHQLDGLPEGHKCARLHGHNYVVVLELQTVNLDPNGFVIDFGDLDPFGDYIKETMDHRHLNDIMGDLSPTAENLAKWLFDWADRFWRYDPIADNWRQSPRFFVSAVRVSETAKTWATYRPNFMSI